MSIHSVADLQHCDCIVKKVKHTILLWQFILTNIKHQLNQVMFQKKKSYKSIFSNLTILTKLTIKINVFFCNYDF